MAAGFFSRFTFAAFAFPIGIAYLHLLYVKRSPSRALLAALGFAAVAFAHIAYDTIYYARRRDGHVVQAWSDIVIAPLNAALYNSKSSNLAEHGLHPRWLHGLVNGPMMLGLGPYMMVWSKASEVFKAAYTPKKVRGRSSKDAEERQRSSRLLNICVATVVFSIVALSTQPHQEPRFLLPLIAPACMIAAFGSSKMSTGWSRRARQVVIVATVMQHVALVLLFGMAHQAGTIPAIVNLERTLCGSSSASRTNSISEAPKDAGAALSPNVELFFWRSFMPPRHLIVPSPLFATCAGRNVSVHDIGSLPAAELAQIFRSPSAASRDTDHFLFAPAWAAADPHLLGDNSSLTFARWFRHSPHVDMDHLGESIALFTSGGASLAESFSYSVWRIV